MEKRSRKYTTVMAPTAPGGVDPYPSTFDMTLIEPLSRSVRLNGFATCLRLERVYWNILERVARRHLCTVNALLSYIDREVSLRHGGVKNFTGLVRVICVVDLLKSGGQGEPVGVNHL